MDPRVLREQHNKNMAKRRRELEFWRRAQIAAYSIGAIFLACLAVYLLSGCTTQTESTPPFIGAWEAEGPGGKVSMQFNEGGKYSALFQSDADTASEKGEWAWREPYLITTPLECREGFTLRLMLCDSDKDSVRVSIQGDVWSVRFSPTEVTTLYRVHHK